MSKKYEKSVLYAALTLLFALPSICLSAQAKNIIRAEISPDNIQRVEVHGGSYYFNPDYIIVKANVPVEFTLKKDSSWLAHDFVMDEKDAGIKIDETLSGEKTIVVKFTPAKTGKFPFYCAEKFVFFKSHRAKGMEGTLEVVE